MNELEITESALARIEGDIYRTLLVAYQTNPERAQRLLDETIGRIAIFGRSMAGSAQAPAQERFDSATQPAENLETTGGGQQAPLTQTSAPAAQRSEAPEIAAPKEATGLLKLEKTFGRIRAGQILDLAIIEFLLRAQRAVSAENIYEALKRKNIEPASVGALKTRISRMIGKGLLFARPEARGQDLQASDTAKARAHELRARLLEPAELSVLE